MVFFQKATRRLQATNERKLTIGISASEPDPQGPREKQARKKLVFCILFKKANINFHNVF